MLSFTAPELRHAPSARPGTDGDQAGGNTSPFPGEERVTTKTAGMQLKSGELRAKGQQ